MRTGPRATGVILITWLALVSLGLLGCTSSTASVSSASILTSEQTAVTEAGGPSSTIEPLLTNPYPTYRAGSRSGMPTKSAWGEELGSAVLRLYPDKDWQVKFTSESNLLTRVVIGPPWADPQTSSADDPVPWLIVDLAREERYTPDEQEYPLQHKEFATDYGHGMITAHYGPDDSSIVSWFVRPDGLYIQVAAVQAQGDHAQPATLLLDEEGVQELTETIAAMIEMGSSTP